MINITNNCLRLSFVLLSHQWSNDGDNAIPIFIYLHQGNELDCRVNIRLGALSKCCLFSTLFSHSFIQIFYRKKNCFNLIHTHTHTTCSMNKWNCLECIVLLWKEENGITNNDMDAMMTFPWINRMFFLVCFITF